MTIITTDLDAILYLVSIIILLTIPISWPVGIFLIANPEGESYIAYLIFYLVLIPVWLILAPIGIPLLIIVYIRDRCE